MCVCLLHSYAWTHVSIFFFFLITFSISMCIMCVCLFSALSRRVGALQISIIIIKSSPTHSYQCASCFRVCKQRYGCQCLGYLICVDVGACDCTWGYANAARKSAMKAGDLLHQGIEAILIWVLIFFVCVGGHWRLLTLTASSVVTEIICVDFWTQLLEHFIIKGETSFVINTQANNLFFLRSQTTVSLH